MVSAPPEFLESAKSRMELGALGRESLAGLRHDQVECRLVFNGDVRQNLAVDRDVRGLQPLDEARVGETLRADSRVETGDPERTEVAFASLPVTVSPVFPLHLRVLRVAEEFGTAAAIPLRGIDHALAARAAGGSIGCSWHVILPLLSKGSPWSGCSFREIPGLASSVSREKSRAVRGIEKGSCLVVERQAGFDALHIRIMDDGGLCHLAFALRALAREQVPTTALGHHEFSGPGDLEALGDRLARFAACD